MAEDLHSVPTPAEPTDARREALVAAFDAMPQTEPVVAPTPSGAPTPVEAEKSARARDDAGKFAKLEPAAAAPIVPIPAPLAPEPEPAWAKPPKSWKAEKHALWEGGTPELREYAFQREEEMRVGVEALMPKAQFGEQIQKAIEPYMPTIRGLGAEPVQAITALMEADRNLRTLPMDQRRAYLGQLASQYGIDLSGNAPIPQQAQPIDPAFSALQNELTNLRGTVLGWQQQQTEAQTAQLQSEITNFAASHEHFEQARPVMQKLLNAGVATDLEDAYTQATRLDPDLFAKSQAAALATAAKEKDQAARIAKAAAVSPRSTTPGAPAANTKQDRRSVLEEAFDGIEGRL